eukprot:jgi/Tetstr1/428669/TSEL_018657.t1
MAKVQRLGSGSGGRAEKASRSRRSISPPLSPLEEASPTSPSFGSDKASQSLGSPISSKARVPDLPRRPHGGVEGVATAAVELGFRVAGLLVAFYLSPLTYGWRLAVHVAALAEASLGRFLKWAGVQTAAEKEAEQRQKDLTRLQAQVARMRERHQDALARIEQLQNENRELQEALRVLEEEAHSGAAATGRVAPHTALPASGALALHATVAASGASAYLFLRRPGRADAQKTYLLLGMCGMIVWLYVTSVRKGLSGSRWSRSFTMGLSAFMICYVWGSLLLGGAPAPSHD